MGGNKEHVFSIFSLTKEGSSFGGSLDNDENTPLLSRVSVNVEKEEIHEEVKEKKQPKQKDFQTIQVPESGQAVREYYRYM